MGNVPIPAGEAPIPMGKVRIPLGMEPIPLGKVAIPTGKGSIPVGKVRIPALFALLLPPPCPRRHCRSRPILARPLLPALLPPLTRGDVLLALLPTSKLPGSARAGMGRPVRLTRRANALSGCGRFRLGPLSRSPSSWGARRRLGMPCGAFRMPCGAPGMAPET